MVDIRPKDLPAAGTVSNTAALVIDNGVNVEKSTPLQIVDAAVPLASKAVAEAGTDNATRVSPLRVSQYISSQLGGSSLPASFLTKAQATALGVSGTATNLGTFTGSIIPDNQTAKQALQALEASLDVINPLFDPSGSDITFGAHVDLMTLGASRLRGGYGLSGISNGWTESDNQSPFKLGAQFDMQNGPGVPGYILNGVLATFRVATGFGAINSGSTISFASHNAIYNAADPVAGGWREYSQHIGSVRAKVGYENTGGNYWLCDWTVAGPAYGADTTKREQFMGAVMLARKQTAGTSVGLDPEGTGKRFWGSTVLTLNTLPTTSGGGADDNDNIATYTMNCGLDISGWAGPYNTSSGDAVGATPGFVHGLKVGGQPISAWTNFGVRSRMNNGVYIQDASDFGIKIENLYPGATGAYIAMPTVGGSAGDIQGVLTMGSNSGNILTAYAEFRRHTAGSDFQGTEFRLRNQIDTDVNSGAYISLRSEEGGQSHVAIGFGKNADPTVRFSSTGVTNFGPMPSGGVATQSGTIRINDQLGGLGAKGGIEFLSVAAGSGYGHRIVSYDAGDSKTPLVFQYRTGSAAWTTGAKITNYGTITLPGVSADPSAPEKGDVWFNTSSNTFKKFDGTTVTTF